MRVAGRKAVFGGRIVVRFFGVSECCFLDLSVYKNFLGGLLNLVRIFGFF